MMMESRCLTLLEIPHNQQYAAHGRLLFRASHQLGRVLCRPRPVPGQLLLAGARRLPGLTQIVLQTFPLGIGEVARIARNHTPERTPLCHDAPFAKHLLRVTCGRPPPGTFPHMDARAMPITGALAVLRIRGAACASGSPSAGGCDPRAFVCRRSAGWRAPPRARQSA
jgi:hypothetical protein